MATATTPVQPSTILRIDMEAPHYKWCIAGIILLGALTQTFAGNSINLAIPRLMAAFGTDLAATQWVATGFLITRTLVIPILGWLGGFLGNRNLFVICLLGFVIASVGCGLASNLPILVIFRLMQGLTIGSLEGLSAVILIYAFPPPQRGLALGLRTVGSSIGHIVSFTVGGYFLEQLSWRLIFFLGLPTGVTAAVLGFLILPQQRELRNQPIDYPGLVFLAACLIPLLLAISLSRNSETAFSTLLFLSLTALIGGGSFLARQLLATYPVVNLRLFRQLPFCLVCGTAFFNNMGLFGAQFMIPIFLQQVMGLTPLQAGLLIVPAIMVSGLSGVVTGRLSDIIPPAIVVLGSLVTLTSVFYLFSSVTALTAVGTLVFYIMLYRVCMFGISTPLTAFNAQILGQEQIRMGQGLMGVVRNIGASLGVTITSVVFEHQRVGHQLLAYSQYDAASAVHQTMFSNLHHLLHDAGFTGGDLNRAVVRTIQRQMDTEAIAAGFRDSFFFIGLCFGLASLPMIWSLVQQWRSARTDVT